MQGKSTPRRSPQLGKSPHPEEAIVISFTEDLAHVTTPHNDVLVITTEVGGCDMKRILIGGGSSTDILFLDAFEKMGKSNRDMKRVNFPLIGFASRTTYPVGAITLLVILGK